MQHIYPWLGSLKLLSAMYTHTRAGIAKLKNDTRNNLKINLCVAYYNILWFTELPNDKNWEV